MAQANYGKELEWVGAAWKIAAGLGWVAFIISFYSGGVTTTVEQHTKNFVKLEKEIAELHLADRDNLNGLATAMANNHATRDLLMTMERRIEALERDARACR